MTPEAQGLKQGDAPADYEPDKTDGPRPRYMLVKLEYIDEPRLAARATMSESAMQELMQSLDDLGQIEPCTLEENNGRFEIITGHRRFLAIRELNRIYSLRGDLRWTCLKALVYRPGETNVLGTRLHENIIREDLNPAEEAVLMRQAMEQGNLDLPGLCNLFKRREEYISGRFALLRGDPEIFNAVLEGKITLGAAHQLNRITEDKARKHYLEQAKLWSPPARVVESWVREWAKIKQHVLSVEQQAPVEVKPQEVTEYVDQCALCGGYRDPGNLISIRIHKWEWESIMNQLTQAQKQLAEKG